MIATRKSSNATISALLFAGAVGATDLAAQEPSAAAETSATSRSSADTTRPKWSVSLGTDIGRLAISRGAGVRGDFMAAVSREWQTSVSQLAFRTELMLGASRMPGAAVSHQFGSISEQAKYSFGRGSFRPYFVAGPGLYFERTDYTIPCLELGLCSRSQLPAGFDPTTQWTMGLGGGIGLDLKIGRSRLFLEQRLNLTEVLSNWDKVDEVRMPFSFGIRF